MPVCFVFGRFPTLLRLREVVLGDTMRRAPARQLFKCSVCQQVAQRLVFSHALVSADNLPFATTHPKAGAIKFQTRRIAEPYMAEKLSSAQPAESAAVAKASAWEPAVEKLQSKQAALKGASSSREPLMVSSLAGSDMSPPAVQPLTSKPGPAPFPKLASRRLPAVNDKSSHHAQPKPTPSATACDIQ
jgi:hypothetical protein